MAQKSRKSRGRKSTRTRGQSRSARSTNGSGTDAIALLKADHREVEGWFDEFEKARSDARKQELARKICMALKAHTIIEEEIFYPAFYEATEEKDIHHEAEVEHDGAKKLIADIEAAGPEDDYFDARISVLSEMIKHHVKEEERRGGMFSKARESDMDLSALGQQLMERKQQAMREQQSGDSGSSRGRRSRVPAGLLARNGRGQQESTRGRS